MMDFIATSDLHGVLPKDMMPFDLLMICGDILPDYRGNGYRVPKQKLWMKHEFIPWVGNLPYKEAWSKVIVVPGNHDFLFESMTDAEKLEYEYLTGYRMKILSHAMYEFEYPVFGGLDSLKIFGTPYCSIFGTWPYMVNDMALEKYYSQIPDDMDILLSHDAPSIYGLGDITEGQWKREGGGNAILAKHIYRVKPLIFHCGHIHSGNHKFECRDGIWCANVSQMNEDYLPENSFLQYQFNEESRTVNYIGYNEEEASKRKNTIMAM